MVNQNCEIEKRKTSSYSKRIVFISFLLICYSLVHAQNIYKPTADDAKALESVIVEKYYVATADDCKDTIGGKLAKGSVTYRIYLDLKLGYKLETVFGSDIHPIVIETSTSFFNDTILGAATGDNIIRYNVNKHNVALDSWVTLASATNFHNAILKSEDNDSSFITCKEQLKKADGLKFGNISGVVFFGTDLKFFKNYVNAKRFFLNDGAWANFAWVEGPTPSNRVLVAQLTTDGKLSFELNAQVATPAGETIRFVAKHNEADDTIDNVHPFTEILCKELSFNSK
jgi:hypothetical protein